MDKEKIKGSAENELDDMVIFRLLDEVIEHGEEALPEMEDYLTDTADSVDSPEVDVEASLKKFKTEHAEFFVKPRRPHHWAYRVCVAAAAVFVANTVCAFALGHSLFNYAAKWGAETFGFYRDDFPTSKDGKIIYYPDGSWEDRSNVPDTNLTGTGLQKTTSVWDDSHRTESFDIIGSDLKSALLGLGLTQQMAPTKLPQGYSLRQINVTKNYFTNDMSILASYSNRTDSAAGSIIVSISRITEYRNNVIEKDDRAVKCYSIGNNEWYIMHNLQHLNAVAMVDGYEVGIGGAIDIAEMKKIIDSIY